MCICVLILASVQLFTFIQSDLSTKNYTKIDYKLSLNELPGCSWVENNQKFLRFLSMHHNFKITHIKPESLWYTYPWFPRFLSVGRVIICTAINVTKYPLVWGGLQAEIVQRLSGGAHFTCERRNTEQNESTKGVVHSPSCSLPFWQFCRHSELDV